jgi:hypothetical protein
MLPSKIACLLEVKNFSKRMTEQFLFPTDREKQARDQEKTGEAQI